MKPLKINFEYKQLLLLSLLLPALLLCSMLIQPLLTIFSGSNITLATKPVDPRDLFRGDYVNLALAIQDVDLSKNPIDDVKDPYSLNGKNVYVSLKPENELYTIDTISTKKPLQGIYLKGRILNIYSDGSENAAFKAMIDYGIDSYYVPEGTGKNLEDLARKGGLIVTLKVRNGYGVIQKLSN